MLINAQRISMSQCKSFDREWRLYLHSKFQGDKERSGRLFVSWPLYYSWVTFSFIAFDFPIRYSLDLFHVFAASRDCLVGLQNASTVFEDSTRHEGIDVNCDRSCTHWIKFIRRVKLGVYVLLDRTSEEHTPSLFITFAKSVREEDFSCGIREIWIKA